MFMEEEHSHNLLNTTDPGTVAIYGMGFGKYFKNILSLHYEFMFIKYFPLSNI